MITDLDLLMTKYNQLNKNLTEINSLNDVMKLQIDDQNSIVTQMMLNLSKTNKDIETNDKLLSD